MHAIAGLPILDLILLVAAQRLTARGSEDLNFEMVRHFALQGKQCCYLFRLKLGCNGQGPSPRDGALWVRVCQWLGLHTWLSCPAAQRLLGATTCLLACFSSAPPACLPALLLWANYKMQRYGVWGTNHAAATIPACS